MARVKLDNVRKVYDGHVAVEEVSFEVADGEFVVLVGPSGSGKSTVLRMIAGLEAISAGEIFIGERIVNDVAPKERDIAMVFQNYALYPHMSVYENMAFALRLRKLPKEEIDSRVRETAAILGLGAELDRNPRHLSGGQRQRVAVGRAIVRKPQVFLFDEPLSNLDAKLRVQMRREISRLHRELAATMIYVTHDQVEAMTMGDRIVVMSEGRVQQVDAPLQLYNHPVNTFVAGFIGSPAMNFRRGMVTKRGDEIRFHADHDGFVIPLPSETSLRITEDLDTPVILGVRPEHLAVASEGTPGAIELHLDTVEPMGHAIFLHGRAGEHDITARVAPQSLPEPGGRVWLMPDATKLHFFDAATEIAIPARETDG